MADELLGDIVIGRNTVRYSDRVGHYVTHEQSEVLRRTAEALGKVAIDDRYPADALGAQCMELWTISGTGGRNEHGVPNNSINGMLTAQFENVYGNVEGLEWRTKAILVRGMAKEDGYIP